MPPLRISARGRMSTRTKIGVIGLSVGGEMAIHAAAHSDAFAAVVSEGASGQSLRDELANPGLARPAARPSRPGQPHRGPHGLHGRAGAAEPEQRGRQDRADPCLLRLRRARPGRKRDASEQGVLQAAGEPKQIWEVPNGQHIAGITTEPEEYERRVIGFFDDALLNPR